VIKKENTIPKESALLLSKDRSQKMKEKGELGVALVEAFRPSGEHADLVIVSLQDLEKPNHEVLDYQTFRRKYKADLDPGNIQILELYTRPNKPAVKVNRNLETILELNKPPLAAPPPKQETEQSRHEPPKEAMAEKEKVRKRNGGVGMLDSAKIIKMAETMSIPEISAKLGEKKGSIASVLRKAGVKAVSEWEISLKRDRALLGPLAEKMSTAQIARHLKKPYNSIQSRLSRCGIKAAQGKVGRPIKWTKRRRSINKLW